MRTTIFWSGGRDPAGGGASRLDLRVGCLGGAFWSGAPASGRGQQGQDFLFRIGVCFSFSLSISSPQPWLTRRHLFPPLESARTSPSHVSDRLLEFPCGACAAPPTRELLLVAVRLFQGGADERGRLLSPAPFLGL